VPSNPAPSEAFKTADAASYDAVAADFDRLAERFSLPIAARVVELAGLGTGARVLDVGCGSGVLTRLAARSVGEAGRVVGVDLSSGMLERAREEAAAECLAPRVEFRRGDAERLDLPSASFDAVLSLFALRHFPDPERAVHEMQRVSRPGAPTVVAVGGRPPLASPELPKALARLARERLLGLLGRAPLSAPRFLESLLEEHLPAEAGEEHGAPHGGLGAGAELAPLLRRVGYERVRVEWRGQASTLESIDDFWNLQVTLSSRARKCLARAAKGDVARLRERHDALCRRALERGGRLVYRSGALVAVGWRPAH
jgi:ubiquinone/menaquinone biosynthesis C-methylase UbiE